MAHEEQIWYCESIRDKFPGNFKNKIVLDVGSLDINGNNKYLFTNCDYIGLDVGPGPNVDIVSPCHLYEKEDETFDTIISTNCFEHDMHWRESFKKIVKLLKPNGMFLFSCAAPGMIEHGTFRTTPENSPLTTQIGEEWGNYYRNISEKDLREVLNLEEIFQKYMVDEHHEIQLNPLRSLNDLYFFGIKK